jgi:hypothetical protein
MTPSKQARSPEPTTAHTLADLEEQVRAYEHRLREGEEVVRRGKESAGDRELVERWETAWVKMLHKYELLSDRRQRQLRRQQQAATEPPPALSPD